MSGFNLPPGCSLADIDRAAGIGALCDVCHGFVEDDETPCTCPECPKCQSFGDPECYEGGKCGGIGTPRVTDHGEACEECHPKKAKCNKHGEFLARDGCVGCELDAAADFEAALNEMPVIVLETDREPTDAELARADFEYDAQREQRVFGRR